MSDTRAPTATSSPRWLVALAAAFPAAVALALYAPVLGHRFTNWDDDRLILYAPWAGQSLGASLRLALTLGVDGTWYPLSQLVHALLLAVAGPSPFAWHLTQWLLFPVAAALVPFALETFGLPRRLGVLASLLWLANPQRVEVVAWAADLKDTLALTLVLAAFALLGRGHRRTSALAFTLACLAKTTVFPLALLVVALEWGPDARPREPLRLLTRTLPWLVPALGAGLLTAAFHLSAAATAAHPWLGGSLAGAFPTAVWLPWQAVGRALTLQHPQAVYALTPLAANDPRTSLALLLWGIAFGLAIVPAWRRPGLLLLLGFGLPFAPVTGFVPLAFPGGDRFAALPSLAVAAALVLAVDRLLHLKALRLPDPTVSAGVTVTALLATLVSLGPARARLAEWHDGVTLWEADRARAPELAIVHLDLAGAYGGAGRWDEAIAELEALRRLTPTDPAPLSHLVFAHLARCHLPDEQVQLARRALGAAGRDAKGLRSVADVLLAKECPTASAAIADALLAWSPGEPSEALAAKVQLALGHFDRALTHARTARRLDPTDEWPRVQETLALLGLGRVDEALSAAAAPAVDPKVEALLAKARGYAQGQPVP